MEELNFSKLEIWQKAHKLTLEIYKITSKFPLQERFGLIPQLRRAAVSVESNIAESSGRYHYADAARFLYEARGSIFEVQTQLLIAKDLKFSGYKTYDLIINLYLQLTKQINSFITYKREKRAS